MKDYYDDFHEWDRRHDWLMTADSVCIRCGITMVQWWNTGQPCTRRSVVVKQSQKVRRRFGL